MTAEKLTLTMTGYWIEGTAYVTDCFGRAGTIQMKPFQVRTLARRGIVKNINDSGFGAQTINMAEMTVYKLFGSSTKVYAKMMRIFIKPSEQRLVSTGI